MIVIVKGADFSACGIGKIPVKVSTECREIASHYSLLSSTTDLISLQIFMDELGYGVDGGIWDKLVCLYLPIFSASKEEMLFDAKNLVQKSISNEVIYESVEGGGMKISAISSKTLSDYSIDHSGKWDKKYKFTPFIAVNTHLADSQIGICNGVSGTFYARQLAGVGINGATYDNSNFFTWSYKKKTVIVGKATNVIESEISGEAASTFNMWDNNQIRSIKYNIADKDKSATEIVSLRMGVGYEVEAIDNPCINYIWGLGYDMTEEQCIILRNAMIKLLTSFDIELD